MNKWKILDESRSTSNNSGDDEIISIILKNRGIKTKKQIEEFLHPDLSRINRKILGINNNGLLKALERIETALRNSESIVVYTDYDVDGLSSGALLWECLFSFGAKVMPYVPNRFEEGYGLSEKGILEVKKKYKTSLIITVDHGISAGSKIAFAKKQGIDVIVIDHHVKPDKTPDLDTLVHTTMVCATALVWYFCEELTNYLKKSTDLQKGKFSHKENLDLVALATVCDLIPLIGVNRIFVKLGLVQLRKSTRVGLNTLIKHAGINKEDIDAYDLGHIIGPRINAIGRLTHAIDALRLLCTKDKIRALALSEKLYTLNKKRQVMTEESVIIAKDMADVKSGLLFISHESFQSGIIGLIAGRLTQDYNLPSIVIAKGEKISKASARSVKSIDIIAILRNFEDILIDVGGHPQAAGFTVETSKIGLLESRLAAFFQNENLFRRTDKNILIDMTLNLSDITESLYAKMLQLQPFGVANSEPVFLSKNITIAGFTLVGRERNHLKMKLKISEEKNDLIEAIGFKLGEIAGTFKSDCKIDTVYSLDENKWNSKTSLQLHLKDVRISEVFYEKNTRYHGNPASG
ncbi:single-stranded-DNA-specific exonuclease RecJ [Candidatus Gottesmanbacteria bacterium RIFCSPHIGHO2_02_FULL_40_13]|uniref:Single-stranded-DNA-specific exonuclease RecJ n=1 Tax=Candidatus Gottesmanbacteria bacterium RIFCSPHIGHO2_02_FULL_40_13 TaxID=1798384 RepID=A0A1F6ABE8_9BACT|nr:MAG: single-stranded-DNA-specific exonuclease RecJ [Candidatus Gottesmanbacteria bacterium RIFCSPHIGHO2_02_FULL_40_13]